jgi:hypothetical protein
MRPAIVMTRGDLITGWLDASIGELIRTHPAVFSQFAYALVTSVDSAIDLHRTSVGCSIVERHPECGFLGNGLVVPGANLANVANKFDLFHGFDEVWWFDQRPEVAKPSDAWIVSPVNLKSEAASPQTVAWMSESGCRLGLGDGIGLNYVTPFAETARSIERLQGLSKQSPGPLGP